MAAAGKSRAYRSNLRELGLVCVLLAVAWCSHTACQRADTPSSKGPVVVIQKRDRDPPEPAPRPGRPPVPPQLSLGLAHGCARMKDGTAWCWGYNSEGQLGDGTKDDSNTSMVAVRHLEEVEQVVAGFYASCARRRDGSVWCWGGNPHGELGDGTTQARERPVRVVGVSQATDIALGTDFGCALRGDQKVMCWGSDWEVVPSSNPNRRYGEPITAQLIAKLTDVVELESGLEHICALRSDGSMWCWGSNTSGQLGTGTTILRRSCSRGPLEEWVSPAAVAEPRPVPGIKRVVKQMALSSDRTCALLSNSSIWCSTDPRNSGKNTPAVSLVGAKQIAVYWPSQRGHVCGIFFDGRLHCEGNNDRGQLGTGTLGPPGEIVLGTAAVDDVVEVRSGKFMTCVRNAQNKIYCWEVDDAPVWGQKIKPATVKQVKAIGRLRRWLFR